MYLVCAFICILCPPHDLCVTPCGSQWPKVCCETPTSPPYFAAPLGDHIFYGSSSFDGEAARLRKLDDEPFSHTCCHRAPVPFALGYSPRFARVPPVCCAVAGLSERVLARGVAIQRARCDTADVAARLQTRARLHRGSGGAPLSARVCERVCVCLFIVRLCCPQALFSAMVCFLASVLILRGRVASPGPQVRLPLILFPVLNSAHGCLSLTWCRFCVCYE